MAVVENLTKPVGGLNALLDHFEDMVGISFFSYLSIVVEMAPKPAWSQFGSR